MRSILVLLICLSMLAACERKKAYQPAQEVPSYFRPETSTARLDGNGMPYCIWYNPEKWLIVQSPFENDKEKWDWVLVLMDPKARTYLGRETPTLGSRAYVYSDKEKNKSFDEVKERVQQKLLEGQELESFSEISSEERFVNGLKVFAWKMKIAYKDIGAHILDNIYYSDNTGSVSLITVTMEEKWNENKKEIANFLNGFCMLKSKFGKDK